MSRAQELRRIARQLRDLALELELLGEAGMAIILASVADELESRP